jgi:hypothetical protein
MRAKEPQATKPQLTNYLVTWTCWARLVGWADFLHDWVSEMGASASSERAIGQKVQLVWQPVQNFLAEQK